MKTKFKEMNKQRLRLILLCVVLAVIYVKIISLNTILSHDEAHLSLEKFWYLNEKPLDFITCSELIHCYRSLPEHINFIFISMSVLFYKIFGFSTFILRLPVVVFNLVTVIGTYLLAEKMYKNKDISFLSAVSMGIFLMFNVVYFYYPVPSATFAILTSYFYYCGILEKNLKKMFIGSVLAVMGIFSAIYTILIPTIFIIWYISIEKKILTKKSVYPISLILILFLPWIIISTWNILNYSAYITASNGINTYRTTGIIFLLGIAYAALAYWIFKRVYNASKGTKRIYLTILIMALVFMPFITLKDSLARYISNEVHGTFSFEKFNYSYIIHLVYFIPPFFLLLVSITIALQSIISRHKKNKDKQDKRILLIAFILTVILYLKIKPWIMLYQGFHYQPVRYFFHLQDNQSRGLLGLCLLFYNSMAYWLVKPRKVNSTYYWIMNVLIVFVSIYETEQSWYYLITILIFLQLIYYIILSRKNNTKLAFIGILIYTILFINWNRNLGSDWHYILPVTPFIAIFIINFFYENYSKTKTLFYIIICLYFLSIGITAINSFNFYAFYQDGIELLYQNMLDYNGVMLDTITNFEQAKVYNKDKILFINWGKLETPDGRIYLNSDNSLDSIIKDYHIKHFAFSKWRSTCENAHKGSKIMGEYNRSKLRFDRLMQYVTQYRCFSRTRWFIYPQNSILPKAERVSRSVIVYEIDWSYFNISEEYDIIINNKTHMGRDTVSLNISDIANANSDMEVFYEWSTDFEELEKKVYDLGGVRFNLAKPSKENNMNIISFKSMVPVLSNLKGYWDTHYPLNSEYLRGKNGISSFKMYANRIGIPIDDRIRRLYLLVSEFDSPKSEEDYGKSFRFSLNYENANSQIFSYSDLVKEDAIVIRRKAPPIYKPKEDYLYLLQIPVNEQYIIKELIIERTEQFDGLAILSINIEK